MTTEQFFFHTKSIIYAEMKKTPFMLIVGEKEAEQGGVAVRRKGEGDLGTISVDEFVSLVKTVIKEEISK